MDSPLGRKIGNALEVEESVDTLNGKGPEEIESLVSIQGIIRKPKTVPRIRDLIYE